LSILLRNVLVQDGFRDKASASDVVIEGEKILSIENACSVDPNEHELIDGKGHTAVIPGLVNGHTHAAMSLLRGLGEEKPLMDWLKKSIWPVEARLTASHIYWGTKLALLEMVSGGITCFGDMYFEMDQVVKASLEMGVRCGISRGIIGDDNYRIDDNARLFDEWNGRNGLVTVQFGPHAPYTVPLETLRNIADLASDKGAGIHFHFLEAEWELEYIRSEYNMDPLQYLNETGLSGNAGLILAHGVWVRPEIMEGLAKDNITIVHNPKSNLKLGSGIQDLPAMLKTGIHVSLGTDGASSNNQLDVWDEMKTAALLHKGNQMDATVGKALDVLRMATWEGSRSLGFDCCGKVSPGYIADLAIIDLDKPHYVGADADNLACFLVYAGSRADVKSTIINGKFVYRDKAYVTADREEVMNAARSARNDLLK